MAVEYFRVAWIVDINYRVIASYAANLDAAGMR